MVQNATVMGANAVLSMRFDSSEIGQTMSEIVAYGTAVVLVPDAAARPPPSSRLMLVAARVILAFVGGITVLLGLGLIVTDGDRSMGLVTILIGAAVLIALVLERSRYRSVESDLRNDAGRARAAASRSARCRRASGRPPRCSSIPPPDGGCGSSSSRPRVTDGTWPRTDLRGVPEPGRGRATLARPAR